MPTVTQLNVIHFTDLENAIAYDCFGCVSYGDAEYTLVKPGMLIEELMEALEVSGDDGEMDGVPELIEELKKIPDDVLVALEG